MASDVRPGLHGVCGICFDHGVLRLLGPPRKLQANAHQVRQFPADDCIVVEHSFALAAHTQESLHQQERILGRGYEEVLASLRQCAGQHPVNLVLLPTVCPTSALNEDSCK